MNQITFGDVANVVSVISGLMTIFGVGGFLSWSFFSKAKGSVAENSISIFAYAVKTGICALLVWPMYVAFFFLNLFVVGSLTGSFRDETSFWDPAHPFAHLASYTLCVLLLVPLYVLICASIYTASFRPFSLFFAAFRRARQ